MKKFISGMLCAAMVMSSTAFAEVKSSMENALAAVKDKIEISSDLTEFDSRSDKDQNGNTSYSFTWRDADRTKGLEISCDNLGRIDNYWTWDNEKEVNGGLSKYTQKDAQQFAEEFVKKTLPETFSDNDVLVCDETSTSGTMFGRGTSYHFVFKRQADGINVNGNDVSVSIDVSDTGMSANLWASYDYNAEFVKPDKLIENPEETYKKAFPVSMHYEKDYEQSKDSKTDKTKLLYGVADYGNGYISAETGEKVTEKSLYDVHGEFESQKNMAAGSSGDAAADYGFSEQEIAELENVAGLKTENEIEKSLRSLPELKMTDKMTLQYSGVFKNEDKYIMNLNFSDKDGRSLYASVNASDGTIYSISNYKYSPERNDSKKELTESQKKAAEEKIKKFFEKVSAVSSEFEADDTYAYAYGMSIGYTRKVNGLGYYENSASVTYHTEDDMIADYYINYTDAEFADPQEAISAEEAYSAILKRCPIEPVYVYTQSGKYELCYEMKAPYSDINALTGEPAEEPMPEYTDIKGHWCEKAVNALSEVGIRLKGNEFKPDEKITKTDLLKFFSDGIIGNEPIVYRSDDFIASLKRRGIVTDDTNGDAPVERQDAFVYMIRFAGYEKLAKLDIYKVNFADGSMIANDKLGYAAILSGLGVISGDGGYVRPSDDITRAEAAVMLYSYLLNK